MDLDAILDELQAEVIAGPGRSGELQRLAARAGQPPRDLLLRVLRQAPRSRRWLAPAAMRFLDDPGIAEVLAATATDYDNPFRCRLAALESLHRLAPSRALAVALELLRDRDNGLEVRDAAGEILQRHPAEEVVPLLEPALGDSSAATRRIAARTLGRVGARQLLPRLRELAGGDPDEAVREAAAAAVRRLLSAA